MLYSNFVIQCRHLHSSDRRTTVYRECTVHGPIAYRLYIEPKLFLVNYWKMVPSRQDKNFLHPRPLILQGTSLQHFYGFFPFHFYYLTLLYFLLNFSLHFFSQQTPPQEPLSLAYQLVQPTSFSFYLTLCFLQLKFKVTVI